MKADGDKTLLGLDQLFAEKAFAIIFLVLMALPALPLPTGGVTHITEIITMLLCLELIVGRRTVWLPKRWLKLNAGKHLSGRGGERLINIIRWFERLSRQRMAGLVSHRLVLSFIGLLILVLTVAAFVAPPFSGLDTLPALGVMVISLGLILEDVVLVIVGVIIGAAGIGLEVAAGTALYSGFRHWL